MAWLRVTLEACVPHDRGYFAYHAVPTNLMAITAFCHHVIVRWLRALRRRSQRHRMTWARMQRIVDRYLPKARVVHPFRMMSVSLSGVESIG